MNRKPVHIMNRLQDRLQLPLRLAHPGDPVLLVLFDDLAEHALVSCLFVAALHVVVVLALGPGELEEEGGKKIVHALEALGRVHAAKAALARRTQLESAPGVERPESDPLVATIGEDEIRRSDVTRALDDLPPFLRQRFATADGMTEFLRKYVADELIFRKAQKMEYDADPEVRRQLEGLLKQLVVGKLVVLYKLVELLLRQCLVI